MLRNQLHDSLSVMDHELHQYQSTSESRWRPAPGGLFRFHCNYLELKYRQTVMVDRAVRKAKCKERYDLPANLRLFAIIIE